MEKPRPVLRVELMRPGAKVPHRASPGAAGYDLSFCDDAAMCIAPGCRALVPTGIAIAAPEGTYARIAPRSGLAVRNGLAVGAGVVDGDYRGEVKAVLFNHGEEAIHIQPGDRIAQLVFERIATPSVVVVLDSLDFLRPKHKPDNPSPGDQLDARGGDKKVQEEGGGGGEGGEKSEPQPQPEWQMPGPPPNSTTEPPPRGTDGFGSTGI